MKVPIFWLNEFCDSKLSARELAERLALTGTEVERIDQYGIPMSDNIVVGKVISTEQHPDADRLKVCQVDVGGSVTQIVCGGKNVAAGQTVVATLPGAQLPGGIKIKAAKLRGVESNGMLVSAKEIGIDDDVDGILVIDDQYEAGTPFVEIVTASSEVLELELTPNRPDCLGIYGVAREVHAATDEPLEPAPWDALSNLKEPSGKAPIEVIVEDDELCRRFSACVLNSITVKESPLWLKAKLSAAGQRSLNNVVDISNYVMLLTGHPIHIFDADKIVGNQLIVRQATKEEQIETLDGATRKLDDQTCVICDADGPTSIAGIMGGARSQVDRDSTRVFVESATWNGPNIQRSSWRLGLRSEASARFEKGLPAQGTVTALNLAVSLLLKLTDAELEPGTVDVGGADSKPQKIELRLARIERLLGVAISGDTCQRILEALGFSCECGGELKLLVTVPWHRQADIVREIDLIEEIARIWGLDKLPRTLPVRRGLGARLTTKQLLHRRAEAVLADSGFAEIVGWSFWEGRTAERLMLDDNDPRAKQIRLRNPLSEDQAELRTTLLPSLLDNVARNVVRGNSDLKLFEVGTVFAASDSDAPSETTNLAFLMTGKAQSASWQSDRTAQVDFFSAKGALERLARALQIPLELAKGTQSFLHPGKAAQIVIGENQLPIGWIGELHPSIAKTWDLKPPIAVELDFNIACKYHGGDQIFESFSNQPTITEDLAVVVADNVAAGEVTAAVRSAGGALLRDVQLFDVYRGDQIAPGKQSLAIKLTFQSSDRTLEAEEITLLRAKIVEELETKFAASLRQ